MPTREIEMNHDQIIDEIRASRTIGSGESYDIRALYEEAKRRQQESDREIVEPEPRRLVKMHGLPASDRRPTDGQISSAARMRA